jgi:hypothetical protein
MLRGFLGDIDFLSDLSEVNPRSKVPAGTEVDAMSVETRVSPRHPQGLIFGIPQAGTLLWLGGQASGIELPLKTLVWEGEEVPTRIFRNETGRLAHRHGMNSSADMPDDTTRKPLYLPPLLGGGESRS